MGNHARVMEPTAGAYGSVEPVWHSGVALPVGLGYANGNPVEWTDARGENPGFWGIFGGSLVCIPWCMNQPQVRANFEACIGRSTTALERASGYRGTGLVPGTPVPPPVDIPGAGPRDPLARIRPISLRDHEARWSACFTENVMPCVQSCLLKMGLVVAGAGVLQQGAQWAGPLLLECGRRLIPAR